jgi:hypothetical protein
MTERTVLRGLALAGALTAGTTAHAEAQGEQRYRLVEVAGSALPVEVEQEWRCRESVTRATLTLRPDSLWALEYTKRKVCGDRTEDETERWRAVATAARAADGALSCFPAPPPTAEGTAR